MRRLVALTLACCATAIAGRPVSAAEPAGSGSPVAPGEPAARQDEGAASPPASEEASPSSTSPKAPATALELRFEGGFALRRLLDIPISGADLGVGFGIQPSARYVLWIAPRLLLGRTENDLSFYTGRVAFEVDIVFDRVRLTPGAGIFFVGLGRAARDHTLTSWGLGLGAALRFDVIRFERAALFLKAAFDLGLEYWNLGVYWGPTFGAGFDFDVHGKRPAAR